MFICGKYSYVGNYHKNRPFWSEGVRGVTEVKGEVRGGDEG